MEQGREEEEADYVHLASFHRNTATDPLDKWWVWRKMKRVVVGGTFEYLHRGHRELLKKAFEMGDYVLIGVTSDDFKRECTKSFKERRKAVENFVRGFGKKYEIVEIHDKYGPTLEEDFDIIVVSPETRKTAEEINRLREERGMKRMEILEIPLVIGEDLLPISSSRIRSGEIDTEGKRLKPLRVGIGSTNPSKIKAVESIFRKIIPGKIIFEAVEVDPEVPPQPFEEQTVKGAINRAKKALGDRDYGVGIEAGLFWNEEVEEYFDKAFCVIVDKYSRVTYGYSGGFVYPPKIIEMVKRGMEIGEAMEILSGIKDIKKKMGAIGYLSKGLIDRSEFNAQAVLMAMIPRISSELYFS